MNKIIDFLKNSALDSASKPSHKRIIVYGAFLMLVFSWIYENYTGKLVDTNILYIFAGIVTGGMGLSVIEKPKV